MIAPLWIIYMSLLFGPGGSERQNVRYERTRYLSSGGIRYGGDVALAERLPKSNRPLFSWDIPPAADHTNPTGSVSPEELTARQATKKWRPTRKPLTRKRGYSEFRNSRMLKVGGAEPKKVIRVVHGKRRKIARKGVKKCKSQGECLGGSKRRMEITFNDVDYFANGQTINRKPEIRRMNRKPSSPCLRGRESCEQVCTEENGRAVCSCFDGFTLVNGTKCVDVDECKKNNGGCDVTCVNTVGSWRCLCPKGFEMTGNKCVDVNECLSRNGHGPCQDTCINTRGSYHCSCKGLKGTILAPDNHSCREVDHCRADLANCSHSCISTFGRSFCTCPDGYELGDDWKTCYDVDECAEPNNPEVQCEFGCVNTLGSFRCVPE